MCEAYYLLWQASTLSLMSTTYRLDTHTQVKWPCCSKLCNLETAQQSSNTPISCTKLNTLVYTRLWLCLCLLRSHGGISEVGHDGKRISSHLFGHGTDGLEGWGLGIPHQLEEGHLRGGQQASALSYSLQPICLSIGCVSYWSPLTQDCHLTLTWHMPCRARCNAKSRECSGQALPVGAYRYAYSAI